LVRKKFIIFQLFLVGMIILLVWGVVIPYAAGTIRDVVKVDVEVTLAVVRKAIYSYYHDHRGVYPGYPNGDTSKPPTETAFVEQLLKKTNEKGEIEEEGRFGPYIRTEQGFTINPLNHRNRIAVFYKNPRMPEFSSDVGWVYTASTGVFDPVTKSAEGTDRGNPDR
jgi:hypothetical protein